MRDGELDLAAFVMNENAQLIRTLVNKYDLEIVAPADIEGLVARDKWLRLGRIPAGYYDIAKPIPATDKLVAQVDTLVMTNSVRAPRRARRLSHAAQRGVSQFRSREPAAVGQVAGQRAIG